MRGAEKVSKFNSSQINKFGAKDSWSALAEAEAGEGKHPVQAVLKELAMESGKIPAQPLEGNWA